MTQTSSLSDMYINKTANTSLLFHRSCFRHEPNGRSHQCISQMLKGRKGKTYFREVKVHVAPVRADRRICLTRRGRNAGYRGSVSFYLRVNAEEDVWCHFIGPGWRSQFVSSMLRQKCRFCAFSLTNISNCLPLKPRLIV